MWLVFILAEGGLPHKTLTQSLLRWFRNGNRSIIRRCDEEEFERDWLHRDVRTEGIS
jgi:hypothetical protein